MARKPTGRPRGRPRKDGTVGTPKKVEAVAQPVTVAFATPEAHHSDAKKDSALRAFAVAGTVKGACEAAKVGRRTWYNWIEEDAAFGEKVMELSESVVDELEEEAIKRAKNGSDTLIIFLLKSKRRAEYGDKQTITVVHDDVKRRLQRQVAIIHEVLDADSAARLLTSLNAVWG